VANCCNHLPWKSVYVTESWCSLTLVTHDISTVGRSLLKQVHTVITSTVLFTCMLNILDRLQSCKQCWFLKCNTASGNILLQSFDCVRISISSVYRQRDLRKEFCLTSIFCSTYAEREVSVTFLNFVKTSGIWLDIPTISL